MHVFKFLKKPVISTLLPSNKLVAVRPGAKIMIIGDIDSDKIDTLQKALADDHFMLSPVIVVTSAPESWINRKRTMVCAVAPGEDLAVKYIKAVDSLIPAILKLSGEKHVIVVLDDTECLGKELKQVVAKLDFPTVELVVMRSELNKAMADANNIKLFDRLALFKSKQETISFLKQHKNIQNTLIWYNAREAKPGKYWVI